MIVSAPITVTCHRIDKRIGRNRSCDLRALQIYIRTVLLLRERSRLASSSCPAGCAPNWVLTGPNRAGQSLKNVTLLQNRWSWLENEPFLPSERVTTISESVRAQRS